MKKKIGLVIGIGLQCPFRFKQPYHRKIGRLVINNLQKMIGQLRTFGEKFENLM